MQNRVRRSSRCRNAGDGVVDGLARHNIARPQIVLHRIHDHFTALARGIVLSRIHLRDGVQPGWRKSNHFHHSGHGVGGVLTAAGARARTCRVLNFQQLGIAHLAGGVRSHRFKHVLNGNVFAFVPARQNGSAVQNHSRYVQPQQRHGCTGDGFIAGNQRHNAVEHMAARDKLNGIGNHLAAYQRGLHSFRAHRDAVADGDGVELHRRASCFADAASHVHRQFAQMEIAGHGADPGIGDSDNGLLQILVRESDCFQKGSCRSPILALGNGVTIQLHTNLLFNQQEE